MLKSPRALPIQLLAAISIFLSTACSPTYDWREVRGVNAPFVVLLPAKPATHSRPVDLNGIKVTMTMTAAEVNGVTFAVGDAELPDQAPAQDALNAMKTALIRNIAGEVRHEKTVRIPGNSVPFIEVETVGTSPGGKGQTKSLLLIARVTEKDRRIYQAVVAGPENAVSRDAVDTFFTSLKLN